MTEFQKEKINKALRAEWEAGNMYAERLRTETDAKSVERMNRRMMEHYAYANGMTATALALGYQIRHEDGVPQIV